MKPLNSKGIFISLFFLFLLLFSVQTAFAQTCTNEDQGNLDACIDMCDPTDQSCIDSCCFDWPNCEGCILETCTAQDQASLDACIDQCDPGDQACIDSCCFDWRDCDCPVAEACTEVEQGLLDECMDQCDPGDQGCIDSCCYDWPDCECRDAEACTEVEQGLLDECMDQCDPGDQACLDSCCYDWPDCQCREAEACTEVEQGLLDECMDQCDPGDQGCLDSCCYDWPDCECREPDPDEYLNCYDACFEAGLNHDDLILCIEDCQEDNPGDWEDPYELKEPRCFAETNFFDYEDVPADVWFWAPINFLTRLEIQEGAGEGINSETFHSRIVRGYNRDNEDDSKLKPGYTKDMFRPIRNLNRFEASKIATLVSCYTIPDYQSDISKAKIFNDVNATSEEYTERVIYRSAEVGLFEGYIDGNFGPYNDITRAEFLKVFLTVGDFDVHSQSFEDSGFSDVHPDDWYFQWVAFANHNSIPIISGYDDGTFRPNEPIRRNEAMKIVTNMMFALGWINQ